MSTNRKDPLGELLYQFIIFLFVLLKNTYYGLRNLNSLPKLFGLLVFMSVSLGALHFKSKIFSLELHIFAQYIIYGALLAAPFFYLLILGQQRRGEKDKYDEIFRNIGFVGKDKKTPYLLKSKLDGKKTIYIFKSNIPLSVWKKARDSLETGLDCSIRQINEGKNKKTVELVTVSSDYKIPAMLKWNDEYIKEAGGIISIGESDLDAITFDLDRTPHVLAAGETGSGKSVVLRTILWQTGESFPRAGLLLDLAKALNCSIDELLGNTVETETFEQLKVP